MDAGLMRSECRLEVVLMPGAVTRARQSRCSTCSTSRWSSSCLPSRLRWSGSSTGC